MSSIYRQIAIFIAGLLWCILLEPLFFPALRSYFRKEGFNFPHFEWNRVWLEAIIRSIAFMVLYFVILNF